MKINKSYAPIVVRGGIGLVFLLLGIDMILRPDYWAGYMPSFLSQDPLQFFLMNGILDVVIGLFINRFELGRAV